MNSYSTSTWGYKIISDSKINFYHVLLPKVDLPVLQSHFPQASAIKQQKDGSITISLSSSAYTLQTVESIVDFFRKKEQDFLDTPKYHYKIDSKTRQLLLPWGLAFQGCLALLLQNDPKVKEHIEGNWQFINSTTGGLYFPPFTLLFYKDYPKIIHPITVQNYEARKCIEQHAALYIRKIIKNIEEAQPGLEGLAFTSLLEQKTPLSQKEITKIINDKSFGIQNPLFSPLFS